MATRASKIDAQERAAAQIREMFFSLQEALMTAQLETIADEVDALRQRAAKILAVRAMDAKP